MRILLLSVLFVTSFAASAIARNPDDEYVKINSSASSIAWTAKKVTGQHTGTVMIKEGSLQVKKGVLTGGHITIDMTSIKNSDMSGEYAGKLEDHLKSDEFFSVTKFPVANLIILESKSMGNHQYHVKANVTIKGITQPVEFDTTFKPEGKMYKADATITIDRTLFDVRYGSGKFYENLGDKTIYDNFDLVVSLVTQ
ncbi:MAG TPA: YceI family protein [Saprospiraceae bacterium]|nr:YceI family protein [Saprospiraceae bacterium]